MGWRTTGLRRWQSRRERSWDLGLAHGSGREGDEPFPTRRPLLPLPRLGRGAQLRPILLDIFGCLSTMEEHAFSVRVEASPLPISIKRKWVQARDAAETRNASLENLEVKLQAAEQRREVRTTRLLNFAGRGEGHAGCGTQARSFLVLPPPVRRPLMFLAFVPVFRQPYPANLST